MLKFENDFVACGSVFHHTVDHVLCIRLKTANIMTRNHLNKPTLFVRLHQ